MKKTLLISAVIGLSAVLLQAQTADPPSLGSGSSGDPWQIQTLNNLYWITQTTSSWADYFIQTGNIDASSTSGWHENAGFSPIGNSTDDFSGSYDGQGYTIDGLTINRSGTDDIGMFGYTINATIENLGLTNVDITGTYNVGSLIGNCYSGTITDCYASGSVDGSQTIGILIGRNGDGGSNAGQLTGCYSAGSVTGFGDVGGLVGISNDASIISECYSTAVLSGDPWPAGGLVGKNFGEINTSYSTGSVTCDSYVGGLVGYNESTGLILNSYARGAVYGLYGDTGGLVGINNAGAITNSYSTGSVSVGGGNEGGLIGTDNSGTINNCFWDTETSGQSASAGGTGKTTSQMKTLTTFTGAGWDFELETTNGTDDYWDLDASEAMNNGYPYLSWQDGGDISLPVELSLFTAHLEGNHVVLEWITQSEKDNRGFVIERSEEAPGYWQAIASYETDGSLKGQGNTTNRTEYTYTDMSGEPGQSYYYRLSAVSLQGDITLYPPLFIQLKDLPAETVLDKAFPNPFNPETYITYHLASNSSVTIRVYNLIGRPVKALFEGYQNAGSYHVFWNGTDDSGAAVPGGTYLIHMITEDADHTQKVVLLK